VNPDAFSKLISSMQQQDVSANPNYQARAAGDNTQDLRNSDLQFLYNHPQNAPQQPANYYNAGGGQGGFDQNQFMQMLQQYAGGGGGGYGGGMGNYGQGSPFDYGMQGYGYGGGGYF
jgi:hypothetical protein